MGFDIKPKSHEVDQQALDRFASGAETHTAVLADPKPAERERQTESMLFRCTKQTVDELNFVFENMNVKSKQKLLELILLPEIKRLAQTIRSKQ